MTAFNLLDEPWIQVSMLDGSTREVSLVEAFVQGDEIVAIHGEVAPQDVAILRLLIAIAHRALDGPLGLEDWEEAWDDTDGFKSTVIEYLEAHRSRFDVRDANQPFFQVAGIRSANDGVSGLEKLIPDVPNGAQFFTTRAGQHLERISWAEASRWLIHAHAFEPSGIRSGAVGDPEVKGGKGYPIGPGWTGQIGTIVIVGSNLLRTILLNTIALQEVGRFHSVDPDGDKPPWERDQESVSQVFDSSPAGPVDCFTWQTRRILLHGDDRGVTGLFLGNGTKADPRNQTGKESMTAWRYSEPQSKKEGMDVYMPLQHTASRSFWRGLPSIIPSMAQSTVHEKAGVTLLISPGVLEFYQVLIRHDVINPVGTVSVQAVGYQYGTHNAVVDELINDTLDLPAGLLSEESHYLVTIVTDAMQVTTDVASALKYFAANIFAAMGANPDQISDARIRAEEHFYLTVDFEFPSWLSTIQESSDDALERWAARLRHIAYEEKQAIIDQVPAVAFIGRDSGQRGRMDVGKADAIFQASLNKALSIYSRSS